MAVVVGLGGGVDGADDALGLVVGADGLWLGTDGCGDCGAGG
ncbi:hypothetical protein [Streptomyces sp. CBMA123]|nr:hypothetical protein [Streptomyces sp. CBMA123]